ncbi:MAG: hypothetical protein HUJ98_08640, partial [Bacteroidaceae bacterium]|nr:hypothetical protein [Bacteroidaceae bacterium]
MMASNIQINAWLRFVFMALTALIVSMSSICAQTNAIPPSNMRTVDEFAVSTTGNISDIPETTSITNAVSVSDSTTAIFTTTPLATDIIETDSVAKKPGFLARLLKSIGEGNKKPIGKKMVWSFVAGPGYGSDTKFGIGLCVTGMYRTDPHTLPSLLSIYSNICTSGNVLLGIDGYHIFPGDRSRIDYNLYGSYYPKYYWGIGYDKGIDHSNKGSIKDTRVTLTGG